MILQYLTENIIIIFQREDTLLLNIERKTTIFFSKT